MKKFIVSILVLLLVGLSASTALATGGNDKHGYDEFGYNKNARIFNGWYGYYDKSIDGGWITGTYDSQLTMKWSKDWSPMQDEPVGAWTTNHLTWYSDSSSQDDWFGWDNRAVWNETKQPETAYMIKEFYKIMVVSNNADGWAEYQAAGAIDAGWGNYSSGLPKYVLAQDTIEIYNTRTGELIKTVDMVSNVNKGLGKPIY